MCVCVAHAQQDVEYENQRIHMYLYLWKIFIHLIYSVHRLLGGLINLLGVRWFDKPDHTWFVLRVEPTLKKKLTRSTLAGQVKGNQ